MAALIPVFIGTLFVVIGALMALSAVELID